MLTSSPIPEITPGLPSIKYGTSLPTFFAISSFFGSAKSYVLHIYLIIEPAFELPPPKPPSIGIFLVTFTSKYF